MKKFYREVVVFQTKAIGSVIIILSVMYMGLGFYRAINYVPPPPEVAKWEEPGFIKGSFYTVRGWFGRPAPVPPPPPAPVELSTGEKINRWYQQEWRKPTADIISRIPRPTITTETVDRVEVEVEVKRK